MKIYFRPGLSGALILALVVSLTACNSWKFGKKRSADSRRSQITRLLQPTPTPTPIPKAKKEKRSLSWGLGLFGKGKDKKADREANIRPPSVVPTVRPLVKKQPAVASPIVRVTGIDQTGVAYRLKVGDPVIVMLEGPGLNERYEDVVDERGNITLLYIGDVSAVRKTATQLERDIKQLYIEKKIYRNLMARVLVPNTFYFIGGEVRGPGRFPLVGKVTLSQAIISAGNFTEWANRKDVVIVRDNQKITINYREIIEDQTKDIELKAGDTITVGRRFM